MAWIEQTGKTSWRVRYLRDDGTYGSESGFHTEKAAGDYAHDLDTDRRRGTWLNPSGARNPLTDWAAIWIETLDVEPRTEENYRRYLRKQILPRWGHSTRRHHLARGHRVVEGPAPTLRRPDHRRHPHRVSR